MTADTQIDTLEAKGLIRLVTVRPELEYLFRHWLVQDAAYGSLLKQERRELHGRVGEALEELYPDRLGELAPVLGMHFEQAGENEKAIGYFVAGGEHALQQNAIREAFDAYDRAATLIGAGPGLPDDPAAAAKARRRNIAVQIGRAQAGYSFLGPEESFNALERVARTAEELGDLDLIAKVHMYIALGRLQHGDPPSHPTVRQSLGRIAEVGDRLGDPSIRALPMALIGISGVFAGDSVRRGVASLEEALPALDGGPDTIAAAFARGALAMGYASLGEFAKADAAAARATEIAQKGDLIAQLDALIAEAMVRSMKGELDTAVPLAQECVDRAEETGASACVVASSWILGDAFHRQGRFEQARDILKRGSDISLVVDRRVWRPTLLAWLGSSVAMLGELADGDWDQALDMTRSINNKIGEAGILGKRAEALVARGDMDAANADFAAGTALAEELGLRPGLARTLRAWGDALRSAGRSDEADATLRRALAVFDELGLAPEASAVRAELALGDVKIAFD
jgi:tetratricopeptide (TPR) repeat protein